MNKKMTVNVVCKDEVTRAKFESLAEKMKQDSDFQAELNKCKTAEEIYEAYNKRGYTDLSFEEFSEQFEEMIVSMSNAQNSNYELNEEDLENVVGGINWFSTITNFVSAIPIAGPVISGIARGVKAGIDGEGASAVVLNIAVGVGVGLAETVAALATAGTSTFMTIAVNGTMAASSAVLNGVIES